MTATVPKTSVNRLWGSVFRVVLMMEITGVMPLPAANARYCFEFASFNFVLNLPVGEVLPARRRPLMKYWQIRRIYRLQLFYGYPQFMFKRSRTN